jgi:hypothetical protein
MRVLVGVGERAGSVGVPVGVGERASPVGVFVGVGERVAVAVAVTGDDRDIRVGADWTVGNGVVVGFWMTAGVAGIGVLIGDGAPTVGGRGVAIWLIGGVEVDRAAVADAVEDNEGRMAREGRVATGGRSVAKGIALVVGLALREYHSAAPTTARPQHKGIAINKMEATL